MKIESAARSATVSLVAGMHLMRPRLPATAGQARNRWQRKSRPPCASGGFHRCQALARRLGRMPRECAWMLVFLGDGNLNPPLLICQTGQGHSLRYQLLDERDRVGNAKVRSDRHQSATRRMPRSLIHSCLRLAATADRPPTPRCPLPAPQELPPPSPESAARWRKAPSGS